MAKRGKRKKRSALTKYLFTSMLILTIITLFLIYFIDILPMNYFGILVGLFAAVDFIFSYLLFSRKPIVSGIGKFLIAIYMILMVIAIIYELNTIDFLKKIGDSEYITYNYDVIVLKDNKAKDIKDISGEKVGIVKDYPEELTTKLNKKVKISYYDSYNYSKLVDKLLDRSLNVIVLEDSVVNILKEENSLFEDKTKIISTVSIDIKQKPEKNTVNITKEPFNVFVSGIDTYGNVNSASRSDVNMIITVNPKEGKILLTSIPRDYYVKLSNVSEYDKLTHAGIYGIDTSVKTVEDFLDIKINYYIKLNFTSLIKTVNTLDGIDVNSKYSFTSQDNFKFNYGINHMNGEKALSFSRERKNLPNGDKSRGENQQAVLTAIIEKITSKKIITKYNSLLKNLKSSFITNISEDSITDFVKMQIKKDIKWDIENINLDGTDGYEYTYSYDKKKLYVMIPDDLSVEDAKNKINELIGK